MSAPTPLLRHLVVWIAAPVAEIYLSLNSLIRHEIWQYALELIAFAALGVLQWKFAKPKWLRSLLWPALVVLIAGLAANGPLDGQIWIFFYVTGVVLLTLNLMKDFQNSLQPNAFPAALIAIMSVVCLRYLDLTANAEEQDKATHHQTLSAGERLIDDLSFNLSGFDDDYIDETPIIIISIDALRADTSKTMSSWDRLASRGAWWEHTMSSSSWTLPAVASLITGSMPGDHGAGCYSGQCQGLDPDVETIVQVLDQRGYRTFALTANPWITRETGFGQGFDHYFDFSGTTPVRFSVAGRPTGVIPQDGARLIDKAIELLDDLPDDGFFFWIHLVDPHMPYFHAEQPEIRTILAPAIRNGPPTTEATRSNVIDGYQKEVDYTDAQLNRLIDALEEKQLFDRAMIVFTSDHGEEFWEHGNVEHGHSHHKEVVEIPLVIVGPGMKSGKRDGIASIVDIVPTIRAMIGLEPGGVDLRKPIDPDRIAEAYGNALIQQSQSARNRNFRVIVDGDAAFEEPSISAYDLRNDPDERLPLVPSSENPVVQSALSMKAPATGIKARLNTEKLKALGYLN